MTAFKKKVLAFALAGTFALSQTAFVNAAVDTVETTNINKYDSVRKEMGLIEGDGKEVSLHKPLERYRAFVLYARMLGYATELQAYVDAYKEGDENFTDAAGNSPYVQGAMAYFKSKGLSDGGNQGEFRPHDAIKGSEFYKMMLQALGYVLDEDFTYAETAEKALELGLIADVEIAGDNELEEVQIGAALYDALNANIKVAADAPAETPATKLALALALKDETAVPYLAALDKVAPTLKVSEPHAIGSRNPGIADGTTATDVTASATVDMPSGMPLQGTLSEPGVIYYDFNGVTGSFPTNADGTFDTTKLETPLEGTVEGEFPFITNNVETGNNNVVKIWAKDIAGNETKVLNWANLKRTTEFNTGGNYVTSGSTIFVVTGTSLDVFFTVDMETTPTVKIFKDADDKVGTDVTFKAITAAEVPADLATKLNVSVAPDVKVYKTTIALTGPSTIVKIGGTSSANFGSVTSVNGKKFTIVSKSLTALFPTVESASLGGVKISFNAPIDPTTVKVGNININDNWWDNYTGVIVAEDNMSMYLVYKMNQGVEYTVNVSGVRTADGQYTMSPMTKKVIASDVTAPFVQSHLILAPNRIRLYLSEPVFNDDMSNVTKYALNTTEKIAAVDTTKKAYIDVTAYRTFTIGSNKLELNFRDGAGYAFPSYTFDYADDKTAPIPTVFKSTNNFVTIKFNEVINKSSVSTANVPGSVAAVVEPDDSRGLPLVTYYFRGSNQYLTQPTAGEISFGDVVDVKGNKVARQALKVTADVDKDLAKAEYKQDGQNAGTEATIGGRVLRVVYDRPVMLVPGSVNNFKLYKGTTLMPYYFAPVMGSAIKKSDGSIFGYTEFTTSLPDAAGIDGDYTVKITGVYDVPSGTTLEEATGNFSVVNNTVPKVVKTVLQDNYLYITYNTPVNDTATNYYNYVKETNTTSGYGVYVTGDGASLSADGKTAKLHVKNVALGDRITVRGVKSVNNVILNPYDPVNTYISVTGSGNAPTLANAVTKITGANKLQVRLANIVTGTTGGAIGNKLIDGLSLYDVKIFPVDVNGNKGPELIGTYYATFTIDNGGDNSVINYQFNKDMFTSNGYVQIDNGVYYNSILVEANGTQDAILATNEYGQKLIAGSNSTAPVIDGIAATAVRPAYNIVRNTSGDALIYIGYNENVKITNQAAANYSFIVRKPDGTNINPADVSVSLVGDSSAFTATTPGVPYSLTNNYGGYGLAQNVVLVTVKSGNFSVGTTLEVIPAASILGITDDSNGGGGVGTLAAFRLIVQ